jgi:hypothetical protein
MGVPALNVQPIWRTPYGVGGKLWAFIGGFHAVPYSKTNLRLTCAEYGHPSSPLALELINPQEDLTADVSGLQPAAIIQVIPPGNGYPLRYWRVSLVFDFLIAPPADVPLYIDGAYY